MLKEAIFVPNKLSHSQLFKLPTLFREIIRVHSNCYKRMSAKKKKDGQDASEHRTRSGSDNDSNSSAPPTGGGDRGAAAPPISFTSSSAPARATRRQPVRSAKKTSNKPPISNSEIQGAINLITQDAMALASPFPSPQIQLPVAEPTRSEPEIPLHTSQAAKLHHILTSAVAATANLYPVNEQVNSSNRQNSEQLAHWMELHRSLLSRQSLTPAEEMQLYLVQELLTLHQASVDRGRELDRQHIAQAASVLEFARGSSASWPVQVPSESPANQVVTGSQQRKQQDGAHGPQQLSAQTHTDHVPAQTPDWLRPSQPAAKQLSPVMQHLQPPVMQHLQPPPAPVTHHLGPKTVQPSTALPAPLTWIQKFQEASRKATAATQQTNQQKKLQHKQEQAAYEEQRRLFTEEAQDLAILQATESRIRARRAASLAQQSTRDPTAPDQHAQSAPTRTILKVKKPAVSRQQELRLAALTNDHDLLRGGSARVTSEQLSEDEQEEVFKELDPRIAAQRLFDRRVPLRNKHGYVRNPFVVNDPDTGDSEHSVDEDNDGGSGTTTPEDGDPSSDYVPSRSTSPEKTITAKQWREFQAFKEAQRQAKSDAHHTNQRHHQHGGRQYSSQVAVSNRAPLRHTTFEDRSSANSNMGPTTPRYNISIAEPPEHGDWRDIQYLVTTFKDKHTKYIHRCGEGHHLSVWECYSATAKSCIIQHLQDIAIDSSVVRNAAFMESLTDDDLYALLQEELGISYDVEVEQELKNIKFEGSILDITNWVIFRTSWQQVLARVTPAGQVQPHRLAELFRNSITDDFMHTWLLGRKHHTWTEAYSAAVAALKDTKWQTCYSKHIITKSTTKATPDKPKQQPAQQSAQQSQQQSQPSAKPHLAIQIANASDKADKPFDPMKFRLGKAGYNINPNLKNADYWENTTKSPCTRCDEVHRWNSELCTSLKKKDGTTIQPPLTATEFATRLKARWDHGFFFSKPINEFKGPTAQQSAAAASTTSAKLTSNKA
jgi:hypothetical protein